MKIKILSAIVTLIVLSACGSKDETTKEEVTSKTNTKEIVSLTVAQAKNAAITFCKLEEKEVSSILKLNGKIDVPPQNLISVSIPMGGYLKSTDLLPGAVVKKGQVIATLEDQQYIKLQQDYLISKVKLKTVEGEYLRQKELNLSKASSDKVFQLAEAEYKNAQINLKALDENLKLIGLNPDNLNETSISKRIPITSPIDGYVSKVNANIGKYLTPSEVLFELVNVDDIHLNLNVYEKDLAKLAIGQKLVAFTNTQADKKYKCEIILIGHSLTMEKNTEVHCHFENYDKRLVPGMYMNAEIELNNVKANTLPEEAVIRFGNSEFIFIEVENNHFEMIQVETGVREKGVIEILNSNQFLNKKVVLNGAYSLLMKLKNQEEEE
jgi:membrane fusion protein, heavy metal efflux system